MLNKGDSRRSVFQQLLDETQSLYQIFRNSDAHSWNWINCVNPSVSTETIVDSLHSLKIPTNKDGSPLKSWDNAHSKAIKLFTSRKYKQFLSAGIPKAVLEGKETFSRRALETHHIDNYQLAIDQARAELLRDLHGQTLATYSLLELFDSHYSRLKQEKQAMRLDDVCKILAEYDPRDHLNHGLEDLYFRLDSRIDHILLDEFQDTSSTTVVRAHPPYRRSISSS